MKFSILSKKDIVDKQVIPKQRRQKQVKGITATG